MTDTISNPAADAGPPEGLIGSITLESVGAAAGVSRSTVSRVVNGSPNVSQKTIDAVMKAIADLGYVHNRVAAALASKQASVVTALIPEDLDLFFKDPYFHAMISGIQDHFASTNLVLNLMIASRDSFPKVLSSLAGGQSDGVLVFSHHTEHQLVDALERRMPVVFGGRPVLEDEAHSYVDVDNSAASKMATEYLIGLGCKHIAAITGPQDMPSAADRAAGYHQAVQAAGVAGPVVESDFTAEGGAKAALELLDGNEPFDAVFAANDLMARAAVKTFVARGLRVPEDIAVVGFDDSPAAVSEHPYLTTVKQDAYEQGKSMAQMLQEQLLTHPREARVIQLPTELVIRETA